ncbi:unnamed protein product [Clonostachys rhizophaga]|uniref:GTP cyclohydrolase II n=1 Tax=Clonostachys rhizophaga TaxID=160324 RepID=A0A9N9YRK5_9HYPO|nr:unnamed protein product [Clonostachys rhizophaga]
MAATNGSEPWANALSEKFKDRIVLTTYPGQSVVDPVELNWGNADPEKRGPILVSRSKETLKKRNAIGAHGGSYAIYNALAIAAGDLPPNFRPNFENTQPTFQPPQQEAWGDFSKIVSMDPFGHNVSTYFKKHLDQGIDVRPTIAITRAHMRVAEIVDSIKSGSLPVDGDVVINSTGDVKVTKIAVEPVWHLPGVASRFNVDEGILRRALFEYTGGSYPELVTRPDMKVFLPPIGGLTVYIFGPPERVSDPNVKLALRIHDECNGSDVFQSDICTCRPYLTFGIEEAIKEAQNGGSGVVIYFRKEGRALGEVVKYLVYNSRKRGGDTADKYFTRTENIAGVRDMRFQALMPDILHWLGIKKIDKMLSMSNMKHDAIVEQGIPIYERIPIPDHLIPSDSRVEIDAKINAGYFTTGSKITEEELKNVEGRGWQSWEDRNLAYFDNLDPSTYYDSPWSDILSNYNHFWADDSRNDDRELATQWLEDDQDGEWNERVEAETTFELANDIWIVFTSRWCQRVRQIKANPSDMENERALLIHRMSKAERFLGAVGENLWKKLQSTGSIIEHSDPDFFVGRRYEFTTYKITRVAIHLVALRALLLRVLFDLYSLVDVYDGAIYETYRGLCFQVWACLPHLKTVHALSAKDTLLMVVPLYEAADSDELRHLYDIKIDWTVFGLAEHMSIEAFQNWIVARSAQWI